jgi:hypothetical protein
MTTPTTPAQRPARAKAATPPALSPAEVKLIQAYRAMEDRQQKNMASAMQALANDFPRHVRPSLRLVAGGAA